MINRKFFFNHCREVLFTGRLTPAQVDGMSFILDVWEANHASKDDRWLAYALATAFHETAFTMQPIRERGCKTYFLRMYDPNSSLPNRARLARRMGAYRVTDPFSTVAAMCSFPGVQTTPRRAVHLGST